MMSAVAERISLQLHGFAKRRNGLSRFSPSGMDA